MTVTTDVSVFLTKEDVLSSVKQYALLKLKLMGLSIDHLSDSDITFMMGVHTVNNVSAIIKGKKEGAEDCAKEPASRDELISTLARAYKFIKSGANTQTNEKRVEIEKEIESYFN